MFKQSPKDDIRVVKTINALMESFPALLQRRKFIHITVNDICEQARISRTTFYTYFSDKYDLLEFWLTKGLPEFYRGENARPQIEHILNDISVKYADVTRNLLEDASNETLILYQQFLMNLLMVPMPDEIQATDSIDKALLSIFCAGGMVSFISWMLKKCPENPEEINSRFNLLLKSLLHWEELPD